MTNILITGASSGLGAALAVGYAAEGNGLILWGRDADRLGATAQACRAAGAQVETLQVDVGDIARMGQALRQTDAERPLDLAIFNAGLGGTPPPEQVSEDP